MVKQENEIVPPKSHWQVNRGKRENLKTVFIAISIDWTSFSCLQFTVGILDACPPLDRPNLALLCIICLRLSPACWITPLFSYLQINRICCDDLSEILALMKAARGLTAAERFLSCMAENDCVTCSIICTSQV